MKKTKFEKILFGFLLLPIVLTAIRYGTVEVWLESILITYILVLFCVCLVRDSWQGSWVWKGKKTTIPLLGLVVFAFIQSLSIFPDGNGQYVAISADPDGTWFVALKLLTFVLFLELLLRLVVSRRELEILIFVVVGVALLSALLGIVRELFQGSAEYFLPELKPGVGFAQFINRNHFALLMVMNCGLIFGLVAGSKSRQLKIFYMGLGLVLVTGLALTASRGGFFTFIVQILFLLVLYSFNAFRQKASDTEFESVYSGNRIWKFALRTLLSLILLVVISTGVVWIGGEKLANRFEKTPIETELIETPYSSTRLNVWRASWELFKDHKIAGVGYGGYKYAIPGHFRYSGKFRFAEAHNDYVELLTSGGLIGAALTIWFLAALFINGQKTLRRSETRVRLIKLGALTGLAGAFVHSLFDFGLHTTYNAIVGIVLVAVWIGVFKSDKVRGQRKRKKRSEP